jgi:hypothetical protein
MSAQDKTVKISVAVDEASLSKAKRGLEDLIVTVNRLSEAAKKVELGFGGGGGLGARVTAVGGQSHTSTSSQIGGRVAAVGGGLADNLTKAVANSANLFRSAAEGSKSSFEVMTTALKRHGQEADREIRKLVGSLKQYESELLHLQKMGSGVPGAAINAAEKDYYSTAQQLKNAREQRAKFSDAESQMTPFGRMRAGLGQMLRGGAGGGGVGGMLGKFAGIAGLDFLAGASIPAIALGTASYLSTAQRGYQIGNMNYALERPMFQGTKEATYGGIFGGQAQAIRGGDIARVHAMRSLATDANLKEMLGDQYKNFLVKKATIDNPSGSLEAFRAGRFAEDFKQNVGRGMEYITSGFNRSAVTGGTQMEIDREKALAFLQTTQPQKFQQMVENRMASDPRYAQTVNQVYGGAFGTIGMADASRTSGGFRRDRNGNALTNTTYDFMARAQKGLWDPGQVTGMMGSLAPLMGWGGSGAGMAMRMMGMTTGGFGAAPMVGAAGQQFGSANGLLGVFQRAIGGRRGLDISAGSNIGNLVAQTMMGGNFYGGSGEGLASTLLAAGGGGGSPGMDMRMSRIVGEGLGATERMSAGGIDPLQKALNASAALKVAGNSPYSTHHALMNMSGATALDIMRTGKVSPLLAGSGITKDLVSKYVAEQDRTAFSRVSDSMLTPEQRGVLARYRSGGVKGMGDKDLASLAGVLSMGTGDSLDAAYGRLRIQASRSRTLRGGTGAHRAASGKSLAAEAAHAQGNQTIQGGMMEAVNEPSIRGDIRAQSDMAQGLDASGNVARVNAAGSTTAALDNLDAALRLFVSTLRRETTGGGRGGPPRTSAH